MRLVHGVVHGLVDEVVESVGARVPDVHGRALANGLEPLEDLDVARGIGLGAHAVLPTAAPMDSATMPPFTSHQAAPPASGSPGSAVVRNTCPLRATCRSTRPCTSGSSSDSASSSSSTGGLPTAAPPAQPRPGAAPAPGASAGRASRSSACRGRPAPPRDRPGAARTSVSPPPHLVLTTRRQRLEELRFRVAVRAERGPILEADRLARPRQLRVEARDLALEGDHSLRAGARGSPLRSSPAARPRAARCSHCPRWRRMVAPSQDLAGSDCRPPHAPG